MDIVCPIAMAIALSMSLGVSINQADVTHTPRVAMRILQWLFPQLVDTRWVFRTTMHTVSSRYVVLSAWHISHYVWSTAQFHLLKCNLYSCIWQLHR